MRHVPWRVTGVTVRSSRGRGRTLASWAGRRVRDVMRSLADGRDTRRIGPGEGALLHLTFSARRRSRLPGSLVHELRLANPDPANGAPRRVVQIGGGLFTAQRFAIDWERLDPSGRLFVGDKHVLTN